MTLQTPNLIIRPATSSQEDINMYHRLWNHPQVMVNVGFPNGLGMSKEAIRALFESRVNYTRLVVIRKKDGIRIGEAKAGEPDENGVSETDVKLLPEFWGNSYGKEIKRELVDYIFNTYPETTAIKADPKLTNVASIKMQEYVGAERIEIGKSYPINNIEKYLPPDGHHLYLLFRSNWELRNIPE